MKHITIDTGSTDSMGAFALFEQENLRPGDTLRIVKRPSIPQEAWMALLMLYIAAARLFLKRRTARIPAPAADDLLNELVSANTGLADLRQSLQEEHQVSVETDPPIDDDYDAWRRFAAAAMNRAYADDEPDISHITLLEPNPDYRPWRPDKS